MPRLNAVAVAGGENGAPVCSPPASTAGCAFAGNVPGLENSACVFTTFTGAVTLLKVELPAPTGLFAVALLAPTGDSATVPRFTMGVARSGGETGPVPTTAP